MTSIQLVEQATINLGEIVDRHGEPVAVAIGRPGHSNLLDFILVYPTKGLAFMGRKAATSEDESKAFVLSPDIPVVNRIYFSPVPVEQFTTEIVESWAASVLIDLRPWPGFGKPVQK